jgi:alkylation response protein AidB-like acyl-CoA dehydrogenase
MTAKVVGGKAVSVAMANTQQLLAGIGFTAEHPYHRYMKRVTALERVLGSGSDLAPLLGGELIAAASAPRLFEL